MIQMLMMVLVLVCLAGCTSTQAIYNNYSRIVKMDDGVNEEEAKIIAQKRIIETQEKRDYRITAPDIKSTPEALKYSEYWFVTFGHNWFSPISTDPLAKTYTELRESQFLVVIEKKGGAIKFYGDWFPKRSSNFDWVFDPDSYKREHPLGLPPGQKGTQVY